MTVFDTRIFEGLPIFSNKVFVWIRFELAITHFVPYEISLRYPLRPKLLFLVTDRNLRCASLGRIKQLAAQPCGTE